MLGAAPTKKELTCAQRIEAQTVKRSQVVMTDKQVQDSEALFTACMAFKDADGVAHLSRGSLTECMREMGLEEVMRDKFKPTVRLAFDAYSADSHFLTLPEFKQLYYLLSSKHPKILPRKPNLHIFIISAKGLPAADPNGKSDPFCISEVLGKPRSRAQTRHIDKTLSPIWNEEVDDRYLWEPGDTLEFSVMDFDADGADMLGKARLSASEFQRPGGFEGELKLQCPEGKQFQFHSQGKDPTLKVRVLVRKLEEEAAQAQRDAPAGQNARLGRSASSGNITADRAAAPSPTLTGTGRAVLQGMSSTLPAGPLACSSPDVSGTDFGVVPSCASVADGDRDSLSVALQAAATQA